MSIALMTLAWKAPLPAGPKMVLLALCDNANDQGECYPSIPTLAAKCSMGERTVQRHITDLENAKILTRDIRTGRSTVYQIDPRQFDTPAKLAPVPDRHHTPADLAPPPPPNWHHTPAKLAPITIKEPSKEPSKKRQKHADEDAGALLGVSDLVALGVEKQVAGDWMAIRKQKRLPLTRTALDETLAQIEKAGMTVPSALKLCCLRGWAGFNVKWLEKSEPDAAPRRRTEDVIL